MTSQEMPAHLYRSAHGEHANENLSMKEFVGINFHADLANVYHRNHPAADLTLHVDIIHDLRQFFKCRVPYSRNDEEIREKTAHDTTQKTKQEVEIDQEIEEKTHRVGDDRIKTEEAGAFMQHREKVGDLKRSSCNIDSKFSESDKKMINIISITV